MAWTQADVDRLDAAYASGIKTMTFGNETYDFHSMDDYLKLRSLMLQSINAAAGKSKSYRLAATSKGV